jgi:hypothetical protein
MLPNRTNFDERKAYQWHLIMTGWKATYVPFPKVDKPVNNYDTHSTANDLVEQWEGYASSL